MAKDLDILGIIDLMLIAFILSAPFEFSLNYLIFISIYMATGIWLIESEL